MLFLPLLHMRNGALITAITWPTGEQRVGIIGTDVIVIVTVDEILTKVKVDSRCLQPVRMRR